MRSFVMFPTIFILFLFVEYATNILGEYDKCVDPACRKFHTRLQPSVILFHFYLPNLAYSANMANVNGLLEVVKGLDFQTKL